MTDDYTRVERIIEDAVGSQPDRATVERVVQQLRLNLDRADEIAHSAMRNVLISIVAFEFLQRAAVGGVSFAGVAIRDLELLRLLLPLVTAFFYYQMVGAIGSRRLLLSAYDNALHYLDEKASLFELKDFLRPPTLLGAETLFVSLASPRSNRAWRLLGIPAIVILLVGPAAGVLIALWRNATPIGPESWPTYLVAVPCIGLIGRGISSLRTVNRALS